MGSESVQKMLGPDLKTNWVVVPEGATAAQIRQEALTRIVETCSGVVLVDSDDLLRPSRVAAARAALQTSELAGCALGLIDQHGKDLGLNFRSAPSAWTRRRTSAEQHVRFLKLGLSFRPSETVFADSGHRSSSGLVPCDPGVAFGRPIGFRSRTSNGLSATS